MLYIIAFVAAPSPVIFTTNRKSRPACSVPCHVPSMPPFAAGAACTAITCVGGAGCVHALLPHTIPAAITTAATVRTLGPPNSLPNELLVIQKRPFQAHRPLTQITISAQLLSRIQPAPSVTSG